MRTLPALALLALLVVPVAAAQFAVPAVSREGPPRLVDQPLVAQLRVDTVEKEHVQFGNPWLLVGHDNVLNLTFHASGAAREATFRLNVTTGTATVTPDTVTLATDENGRPAWTTIVIHPQDVGVVTVVAEAVDAFQPSGDPVQGHFQGVALAVPSVTLLDPPPDARQVGEDGEEYRVVGFYGSSGFARTPGFVRLRSGDALTVRIEATNPLDVATPPFTVTLAVPGNGPGSVEIPSLDPGQTVTLAFDEWTPVERRAGDGGHFGFGPTQNFQLRLDGEYQVAGVSGTVSLAKYALDKGAVVDVAPVTAVVEVVDGLTVDILVPTSPVLGAPTRIRYNATNHGTTELRGVLTLGLGTPMGLHYEVQGPESYRIPIVLGPGERVNGALTFTPRVTGDWNVMSSFRSSEGFGYGGGGSSFEVRGPLVIQMDRQEMAYARIGERVRLDLSIATLETLQDAELRVATGEGYGYFDYRRATSGETRPGLQSRLVDVETSTASLGTLRPGGVVNATLDVSARSSGRYNVVPYVLAEGFAYTSSTGALREMEDEVRLASAGSSRGLQMAVQMRPISLGWALAPFAVGLAFFVGVWTLRTRFVR